MPRPSFATRLNVLTFLSRQERNARLSGVEGRH